MNKELFQVIDANLNRTREALRVCEDIARFVIIDKNIARSLKLTRHSVTKALLNSKKISLKELIYTRDTKKDVLKFVDFKKHKKVNATNIFMSNIERAKESLRVLEECSKIVDLDTSRTYRRLRFNTYDAEKKFVEKTRYIPCSR